MTDPGKFFYELAGLAGDGSWLRLVRIKRGRNGDRATTATHQNYAVLLSSGEVDANLMGKESFNPEEVKGAIRGG